MDTGFRCIYFEEGILGPGLQPTTYYIEKRYFSLQEIRILSSYSNALRNTSLIFPALCAVRCCLI
jgi:hypothetical protein